MTCAPSISARTPCSAPRRAGASRAGSAEEAVAEAEAVVTMLPAGKHVRAGL